MRQIFTA